MSVAPLFIPRPDPSVRDDGLCWVCKGPRRAKQGRYSDPSEDPFCSTTCARSYHGVPLDGTREQWK